MKNQKNNKLPKSPDVILTSGGTLTSIFDLSINGTLKVGVQQIAKYANGGFHVSTAGCRTKKYLNADVVLHPISTRAWIRHDSKEPEVEQFFAIDNFIALDLLISFLSEQKEEFQAFLDAKFFEITRTEPICLMPYKAEDYLSAINYFEMSICGVPCKQVMVETVIQYVQKVSLNNSK